MSTSRRKRIKRLQALIASLQKQIADTRKRIARLRHPQRKISGLSKNGAEFIASFEGFSATPYDNDGGANGGNCTIGYGTLIHTGPCVKRDFTEWGHISHERALRMLQDEANNAWRVIEEFVKVPLNQHQADALISFAYNVGVGAFMSSTLLRKINEKAGEKAIRYEFGRWVRAGAGPVPGLVRRREAEADLYFTP